MTKKPAFYLEVVLHPLDQGLVEGALLQKVGQLRAPQVADVVLLEHPDEASRLGNLFSSRKYFFTHALLGLLLVVALKDDGHVAARAEQQLVNAARVLL